MLGAWRADSGLVCSTPVGSRPESFMAEVECAFLNTLQARWQYVGESLGMGFAQGKSMLWRKPFLNEHGGIRALAAEIAEDAAATKLVRDAGKHVHLVDSPFEQPLGVRKTGDVWRRQLRWARLRRFTFPLFFAPEILVTALVPAILGGIAAGIAGFSVTAVVLAVLVVWYGAEAALAAAKGWHVSWRLPLACLVRDSLAIPLWLCAWASGNVVWRGNTVPINGQNYEARPSFASAMNEVQ
jgi:ceramide glucosyltransferase